MDQRQTFVNFLTPGSGETIISGAALSGGNPAAQAFTAEYNPYGIKTNLIIPLTQPISGNNAGVKNVVGSTVIQTTQTPVSSSGNIQSSANMGYETGIGWWMGFDQGTPKLFIGDEDGDNMKWTGSALIITGQLVAGSIDIPDTTSTNSFHVDSMGDSWWGSTTFANAPASISNAGDAIFKSYSLLSNFTAGQDLTKGQLACMINTTATWGDQTNSSTNKSTTADLSAFTYVDQANPASAFGAAPSNVKLGLSGGTLQMYGKIDLVSAPPGLPAWQEIDTVQLRIYVTTAAVGAVNEITFSRLTAAFTESTVTWNTRPADDGVNWASAGVATPTINGETCASTADSKNLGYIEFDITELYKLWSQGTYTNNGFAVKGGATASIANFGGRSVTNGGAFNQAPFFVSIIVKDNPGSGTTFAASDGKAYVAKHSDYQYVKNIIGIVGADTLSGGTVPIYTLADKSVIPSSILTVITGRDYYLTDDSGSIGTITNDVVPSNFWDRKVGVGTASGLSVDLEKSPLFIRAVSILGTGLLPPPNARYATIVGQRTSGGNTDWRTFHLEKSFFTSDTQTMTDLGGTPINSVVSWASGTSGLLTSTNLTLTTVSWYR